MKSTATAITLLVSLGVVASVTPASAQLTRDICDQNEDGFVDRQEAMACGRERFDDVRGEAPYMTHDDFLAEVEEADDPEGLFAQVDTDGDGQISPEEWDAWQDQRFAAATETTEGRMAAEDYERFSRGEAIAVAIYQPEGTDFGDIVAELEANDEFSTLVDAVESADLGGDLSDAGPFTVFAPTNQAFAELSEGALDKLTPGQIGDLLKHHIVAGDAHPGDELPEQLEPMSGSTLNLALADDGGAVIERPDGEPVGVGQEIATESGFIHAIDGVLVPQNLQGTF